MFADSRLSRQVPIEVVVHVEVPPFPGAGECCAAILQDDVVPEVERKVRLHAAVLHLIVMAEGKDVVFDPVLLSIVLVEASAFAAIGQVGADLNPRGAFIGIQTPTAVIVGQNVVDHVVHDPGPLGFPQGVDGAHIGQLAPADVVDVVVGDEIPNGGADQGHLNEVHHAIVLEGIGPNLV